ncbi:hypothetical protein I7I53_11286 [Histoplasma capsulatum var. duboisii H88]|uniref:Uncharacterized protein n=1 Tax=Ajellomyces capsulatus (strain H88) TaxID=544711 RepID=A0A8A1LD19_AJEC8|nr:hypothetical protein I7I53_11286 [Histoplasma capsulatum var. duboisii H88]
MFIQTFHDAIQRRAELRILSGHSLELVQLFLDLFRVWLSTSLQKISYSNTKPSFFFFFFFLKEGLNFLGRLKDTGDRTDLLVLSAIFVCHDLPMVDIAFQSWVDNKLFRYGITSEFPRKL